MNALTPVIETPIADVMTSTVQTIAMNDTVAEAAKIMVDDQFSAIPVVDGQGKCVGILSRTDLTELFLQEDQELAKMLDSGNTLSQTYASLIDTCDEKLVREMMTHDVAAITKKSTIQSACQLMSKLDVHHLPVVDEKNVVVGIVSTSDIIKLIATEL